MTTCWTETNDDYGYSGVAFTVVGDVWTMNGLGTGTGPLLRVDFPGLSSIAETIDLDDLTAFGGTHLDPHTLVCAGTDPLVCAVDNDGHSVLVNAATDSVLHDFGSLATNNRLINSGVYNAADDVLYFSFVGDAPAVEGVYVINPDGSGKSEVWSTTTANITANGKLVSASDDGVWWTTDDDVYRVSVAAGVDSLGLTGLDNLLVHDPDDPTRVLKYDLDDPERFTWTPGTISSDTPTCDDPFPTTTSWVAISQDGSKGLLVNQTGVVLYWGVLVRGLRVGPLRMKPGFLGSYSIDFDTGATYGVPEIIDPDDPALELLTLDSATETGDQGGVDGATYSYQAVALPAGTNVQGVAASLDFSPPIGSGKVELVVRIIDVGASTVVYEHVGTATSGGTVNVTGPAFAVTADSLLAVYVVNESGDDITVDGGQLTFTWT